METKEEKITRLRKENETKILLKKQCNQEYIFDGVTLRRANVGYSHSLHVDMIVRVRKPYKALQPTTYRRGVIKYIKIENGTPVIGVMCGKKNIVFEKSFNEVYPDNTLQDIIEWENIEVPERLTKMSTENLLREFRKRKREIRNTSEEEMYKKELYLREHVGDTNAKAQNKIRKNKLNGKRK